MNNVIFQEQMTSASTHFPRDFKTVNCCLIYHTFLALALKARCVRIPLYICMHTIFNLIDNLSSISDSKLVPRAVIP